MSIYFKEDIVHSTLEIIKTAHDCADELNDIHRIEQAIFNVNYYGDVATAEHLDAELRNKYPCIDNMLNIADSMPIQPSTTPKSGSSKSSSAIIKSRLEQDKYGIICGAAVKKGIVKRIEHCIKEVRDN